MKIHPSLACAGLAAALAAPAVAQSVQVHAVQPDPTDADRVWVANRDNASVSLVDVPSGQVLNEIPVGVWPRSLAFNEDLPAVRYHSATLTGLEPDTLYAYRVRGAEGHWSEWMPRSRQHSTGR